MKMKGLAVSVFVLTLGVFACGKKMTSTTLVQDMTAPEWVIKGSGAFDNDKGKIFYGVSSVTGIKNSSLKRVTAENRARNEVAKILEAYTSSLMKDYEASTTAGAFDKTSEEQHVEQAVKTVVTTTLSGVTIIDHWEHPARDEYFALARLDMEAFKSNIERMSELNQQVKEFVKSNADKLHDELSKEEERGR